MGIPLEFLIRFGIPLIVAAFYLEGNVVEQLKLYDRILEESDRVLSIAEGEGEGPTETYDYIIIGGGAAGAVLANRLSASGDDTVLVIEAGGDPNPISEVPMFTQSIWVEDNDMMLKYLTTPQKNACLSDEGVCWFPRGKALGGSSTVNGMVYNRCNSKDYDRWANFTGDPIWSFASVVDAFRKVESYHGFYENNAGPNHGADGEIYIGKVEHTPGVEVLFEALAEKEIEEGDLNSGLFPSGFSRLDYNIKEGLRHSTYHGFIKPILDRENLQIYRYAWAQKVHLNAEKRAFGVTYKRHGQTRYVTANKEIILAAGVVDTPKILLLSGIGPKEQLAEHGIETVLDMPAVGEYLQEHLGFQLPPWTINKTFGIANPLTPATINTYIQNASGPLNQLNGWGVYEVHLAMGYFSSRTYNDPSWPDLHAYINELVYSPEGKPIEQRILAELELVRTDQLGTIKLASANPDAFPIIDPGFLQNPGDTDRLIEGIEHMLDIFLNSSTYQALGIKWSENYEGPPQCEQYAFASREYWRCFIQTTAGPALHPTSTCRMGPNNTVAVVDSKLRVFGTTGLRIIDSSVMPFVPNGNTNLPSIMIGEMGSRILLNQI